MNYGINQYGRQYDLNQGVTRGLSGAAIGALRGGSEGAERGAMTGLFSGLGSQYGGAGGATLGSNLTKMYYANQAQRQPRGMMAPRPPQIGANPQLSGYNQSQMQQAYAQYLAQKRG
jgi:hypothetical protein